MSANFTHAEKPRVVAAFLDLALAGFITVQAESAIGIDAKGSSESMIALGVGLLFLSCKDCIGGISPGKGLSGCILIDESTLRPVDPSTAFKRNGRLYGSVAGVIIAAYILGSAAGEAVGTITGCFALIGLFSYFASKIDSWEGTAVALRASLRLRESQWPPEAPRTHPEPQPKNPKPAPLFPPKAKAAPQPEPAAADLPERDKIQLSFPEMLELLNLSAPFTAHELKAAYRKAIGEYHPDRVTHLAKEIQKIAEQRSKQINHAYEHLKPRSSNSK